MKTTTLLFALSVFSISAFAAEDAPAARQFQALLDEYEEQGGARAYASRFLHFAEQHQTDPTAADALLWVVKKVRGKSDTTQALEMLAKHHIRSEKLGATCKDIAKSRSIAAEKLLRAALESSPHQNVRAQAGYYLAALLDLESEILDQLKSQPDLTTRILQYYGKEYGQHLMLLKPALLERQREQTYERLLESFSAVEIHNSTMGEIATKRLFAIRHLTVGKVALEISAEDIHGKAFKLGDYRGKVVMLSFWGHW